MVRALAVSAEETAWWLRPWSIVGLVTLVYVAIVLAAHQGDPLALVNVGTRFDPGLPEGSMGYDGQFSYQIARDPVNAWMYIDEPAYRYQRILYPLLARALALGNSDWIPWSLLIINILALTIGTAFTEHLLISYNASPWYALVYGLNIGMLMAVRLDLNEPLAFLFVQAGAWLWARERAYASAAFFGLAALAKEVTLLLAAGYVLFSLLKKPWKTGLMVSGLVIGPFLFWQIGLRAIFGSWAASSGGALATPFELIPLHGWWGMAAHDLTAFLFMSILVLPMAILPALLALGIGIRDIVWRGSSHPVVYALLLQAAAFLFLPASNILDPLGLARFTVGLVVAFLAYGAQRGLVRVLVYSQLWMITLVFLVRDSFLPF